MDYKNLLEVVYQDLDRDVIIEILNNFIKNSRHPEYIMSVIIAGVNTHILDNIDVKKVIEKNSYGINEVISYDVDYIAGVIHYRYNYKVETYIVNGKEQYQTPAEDTEYETVVKTFEAENNYDIVDLIHYAKD